MIKEFLTADSSEDALRKKQVAGEGGMFLAGGTEINRLKSPLSPSTVISLKGIGLGAIERGDNVVDIGAVPHCRI